MCSIQQFIFNEFQTNCYVLYDDSGEAIIIDGAVNSERELNELTSFFEEKNLNLKYILNTHGHLDHVCGNSYLKPIYKKDIISHKADDVLIENAQEHARQFYMEIKQPPKPDKHIEENDIVSFGNTKLKVLLIPGHTPGSIALYSEEDNFVITGDALFQGSIGRTDLPSGSYNQLINSISTKLFTLPDKTVVLPGHGNQTSIGYEKVNNPFF